MAYFQCIVCGVVVKWNENVSPFPVDPCPVCGAQALSAEDAVDVWLLLDPSCDEVADADEIYDMTNGAVAAASFSGVLPTATPVTVQAAAAASAAPAEPVKPKTSNFSGRLVIIGSGSAGFAAAQEARRSAPESVIVMVTEESDLPYNRCLLTDALEDVADLAAAKLKKDNWYADNNIEVIMNARAKSINRTKKTLSVEVDGEEQSVAYDRLIIASGARPFVPPLAGLDVSKLPSNVTAVRTTSDIRKADSVLASCENSPRVALVGAGLLNLESIPHYIARGCHVTVIEFADRIASRQLDATHSALLQEYLLSQASGHVDFMVNAAAKEVIFEDGVAKKLRVAQKDSEAVIDFDLLVLGAGQIPNVELAEAANLTLAPRKNGIVVNDRLQTLLDPSIYAVGDCASLEGAFPAGNWTVASFQGSYAAKNAIGLSANAHKINDPMFLLEIFEWSCITAGMPYNLAAASTDNDVEIVNITRDKQTVNRFAKKLSVSVVFHSGIAVSCIAMGSNESVNAIKSALTACVTRRGDKLSTLTALMSI